MINEEDLISSQTDDIVISACPVLMSDEVEQDDQFMWGYYFCIENNSPEKIHLIGKNWNITDEKGNSFCDNSMGFKGEIPELEPGEYFEFTSSTPVNAANAVFYGSCKVMTDGKNITKDIRIPTFSLSADKKQYSSTIN